MPDFTREDFTVAIAQRRLLEAIAAYGSDLPPADQAALLNVLAMGMVTALSGLPESDDDVVAIGAGLGELIVAVAHERLDVAEEAV